MNTSVLLFFLHNVLATFLIGGKFVTRRDPVVKQFGIALLLDGVAFAIWSAAVALKPPNLEAWVTMGVIFFIASLVVLLSAGIQGVRAPTRRTIVMIGAIVGLIIFYLKSVVYPSAPSFSTEGLFFFNPHPIVQMLYLFGLAVTALPAIDALSSKFRSGYATVVRYGFIAEIVGGVILITSINGGSAHVTALNLTGWIIGLVYLVLWTTLLFSRKAWSTK